jgi:murein DD-endopeptidase MepM/ murein hydrolase activator NlpD
VKRFLAALLAAAMLPAILAAKPTLQQRIHAEQVRGHSIRLKLHQKRLELDTATNKVNDLQGQLDQTNSAIAAVNGRLDSLDAQARSTQLRLDWNTTQLRAAQKSLERHDAMLKRRLVDIYENGNLDYLNVLLSAHSFSEFVERWEDLRLLIAANEASVRERKAIAKRVAAVQNSLQQEQVQLAAQQQAQNQARSQLSALATERSNLVAVAADKRHGVAVQVSAMEDLSAGEEANLEALIRQFQAEQAAANASQRRAAGIAGVIPAQEGAPTSLSWPVTGPITSPFGWRHNPFGGAPDFHQGLDIGVGTGTTVTAAASGTVIMAQWYGGYGNYILIDHGGGISTGYGHLSAFYVSAGQHVTRGQAIAASGSTGMSTGPHLHFEVRKNGKPIDPSPWLH